MELIYIKRRKNWFQRQRVAVGEPIYLSDFFTSRFPSMEEIEKTYKKGAFFNAP